MEIKKIGVLGAGTMGRGIAHVVAQAGFQVIMRDIEDRFVQGGLDAIDRFLTRSVEKQKVTQDEKKSIMDRITGTVSMEEMGPVDFVIEAVLEDLELKKGVFAELDRLCRPEVIFTSNTSSMSITEIAAATGRPDRVAGMHFFNPAPLMRLVEVIRGFQTSDETIEIVTDLTKRMKKEPVQVKKDSPGFIVNRVLMSHLIEAMRLVEEGVASVEDVDKAVKLGLNYPMGPFELMDLTGIDIVYHVTEYFYKELNKENKWVSPQLVKSMIRANRLGRKTKAGWYEYE
ncbi:MAG: 3-hydroxybutyryl-CoA dehydrogenase [Proteobacteria bacterium]|nr:3-hydroxybutyryl-CoA dehydrogenase [Pseudomonadota bacterium]NIS69214.1 3-hydroxybutyryl-CoA dehydrogenase [Pseudomonadota bacterium]